MTLIISLCGKKGKKKTVLERGEGRADKRKPLAAESGADRKKEGPLIPEPPTAGGTSCLLTYTLIDYWKSFLRRALRHKGRAVSKRDRSGEECTTIGETCNRTIEVFPLQGHGGQDSI